MKTTEIKKMFDSNEQQQLVFNDKLKYSYKKSSRIEQQFLGKSLLIGLTFLRLAIMQCPSSLEIIKSKGF